MNFQKLSEDLLPNLVSGLLLFVLSALLSKLWNFICDKLSKNLEIKFVSNTYKSYVKSKRFWQNNLFIKDTKDYYKTNNFINFERDIIKYPTVSIVTKNKKSTASLYKYYKYKIFGYIPNYEQVFNIKPIIPEFSIFSELNKQSEITTFNQDLVVEISHHGFDDIGNFKVEITDQEFKKHFQTQIIEIETFKTGQNTKIILQKADKLIKKDRVTLEFKNIKLSISYKISQKNFKYGYILQNRFGYGTKIKFNTKNGFYSILPGGMGGAAGYFEIQSIYICESDFQKNGVKECVVEINRELSGNENSGSNEELSFQIIPDKPCQFQIKFSLLDEEEKQSSNILKRKYKTLFPR